VLLCLLRWPQDWVDSIAAALSAAGVVTVDDLRERFQTTDRKLNG
jgi:hypothetical protein